MLSSFVSAVPDVDCIFAWQLSLSDFTRCLLIFLLLHPWMKLQFEGLIFLLCGSSYMGAFLCPKYLHLCRTSSRSLQRWYSQRIAVFIPYSLQIDDRRDRGIPFFWRRGLCSWRYCWGSRLFIRWWGSIHHSFPNSSATALCIFAWFLCETHDIEVSHFFPSAPVYAASFIFISLFGIYTCLASDTLISPTVFKQN